MRMTNWLATAFAIAVLTAAACGGAASSPASSPGAAPSSASGRVLNSVPVALSASTAGSSGLAGSAGTTGTATVVGANSASASSALARPIRASTLGAELSAVGLEPEKLPALAELSREQLNKVMSTFTKSTGLTCRECHGSGSLTVDTPHKRLARHMWNDFVRGLALKEGGALYCDSCHQGRAKFLDHAGDHTAGHSGEQALSTWMNSEFVQRLARTDRKPHACATCHGAPFKGAFLADWQAR
jgi:hypothetical protein